MLTNCDKIACKNTRPSRGLESLDRIGDGTIVQSTTEDGITVAVSHNAVIHGRPLKYSTAQRQTVHDCSVQDGVIHHNSQEWKSTFIATLFRMHVSRAQLNLLITDLRLPGH